MTLTVEGVSGSTTLAADVVSHLGSRLHGWVSQRPLQPGRREVIEFGVLLGTSAKDFETRLWSQTPDKSVVFKIVDVSIETRGP